jgi:carboxymethylenebutenolidase
MEYQMNGNFQTLKSDDGFEFRAFVSKPASETAPGIVLLQEEFGINNQIHSMCDLLAEEGYLVVAPDLFARLDRDVDLGHSQEDVEKGIALSEKFDTEQGLRDIAVTIAALRTMPGCDGKVGTIGFSLGGTLAVLTAARHDVQCAISYYGVGIERHLDEGKLITSPLGFMRWRCCAGDCKDCSGARFSWRCIAKLERVPLLPSARRYNPILSYGEVAGNHRPGH